jgi:catechol 2,3-dioxygenase-like lactoylglutathione lyase family enzyme
VAVSFDHIALPALDDDASARFLGSVLGLPVTRDGAEDEIPCVRFAEGKQVLFQRAERFDSHHAAFRVSPEEFVEVVARLRSMAVPFGNDPEAPTNGLVSDPLGGHGRVYFLDPNGHLLEVCA